MQSAVIARWSRAALGTMEKQMEMKFFERRLATFNESDSPTSFTLAGSGFYVNESAYECYACGLRIPFGTIWDDEGLVREFHLDASPRCMFANGSEPNLMQVD